MSRPVHPSQDGAAGGGHIVDGPIVIGLVNNMSPRAMRTTERQFRELLAAAPCRRPVRLELFTLHDDGRLGPTQNGAQEGAREGYGSIEDLRASRLDGMIVTGMEPVAPTLPEEPAWPNLTRLVDWAVQHGIPTVWSCLAAHAAVLHLDGIARVKLPRKLSGLFECTLAPTGHPLAAGCPAHWRCPHSRHNGLPEAALRAGGYDILSASTEAGVDMFVRDVAGAASGDGAAPFLFCQGHPEYGPDVLMREYVRDLKRYLDGDSATLPDVPAHYLDRQAEQQLRRARDGARPGHGDGVLAATQAIARSVAFTHGWQSVASDIYGNWLASVAAGGASADAACGASASADAHRPALAA